MRAKKHGGTAIILAVVGLIVITWAAHAQEITAVGWNLESGEADPSHISKKIKEAEGVEWWGLSEVQNRRWMYRFRKPAGVGENAKYLFIPGTTGKRDYLCIIHNTKKLELI